MQLKHLHIKSFRNLRDLAIDFGTHLPPLPSAPDGTSPQPIRSHAIIGQNGSGKSNLIEALITIFRNIDLELDAEFDYTLEYEIRGHTVRLEADRTRQRRPFVTVDGDSVTPDYLTQNDPPDKESKDPRRGPRLLPTHIFAYYSGRNERIEALFQEHVRRFNRRQEVVAEETLPAQLLDDYQGTEADIRAVKRVQQREESFRRQLGDDRLRRLFYCRGGHSQLVLLACLLSDDPVFQKVLKNLGIESLESALFVLKEPYRLRRKRREGAFDESDIIEGDPRFWYARGNVVSEFLDKLWKVAWAPIREEVSKQIDFRGRTEKQRQVYLFVPTQEKLNELGEMVGGTDSFFRYAEGAYIGDLIEEVRITVKKRGEDGSVDFTQLSEGEQQMLTVLGLMRITRESECLYLLDEPDTHLNPIWKLRYFDDIEGILSAEAPSTGQSQALVTTHDPIMLGGLAKEQVHILCQEGGKISAAVPLEDPRGMGVAGLLKSDLFGLTSTLDQQTLSELQRRNELVALRAKRELEQSEKAELDRLQFYLADLGFAREFRDPMYQLFIEKMYEVRSQPLSQVLSPKELKEQEALAERILKDLVKNERLSAIASLAEQAANGE